MASGGIYSAFLEDEALTPGEDRTLRWVVKDGAGANVSDMAGWTVTVYWLDDGGRKLADGPTALDAIDIFKATAVTSAAPHADLVLAAADWVTYSLTAIRYEYELWRTDTGNVRRLAYGPIQVVS